MTSPRSVTSSCARLLALSACVSLAAACADGADLPEPGALEQVGQVGLELSLGAGINLNTLNYAVTGPGAFTKMGVLNVAGTDRLVAIISPLPAGNGYSVTVTGTGSDGLTTCTGSASFGITAGGTTVVALNVRCREPQRQGSVLIEGTVNVCPVIDGIGVNPARAFVGSTIALTAVAHDLNSAPAPLAYAWTTSSGMIGNPTSANATFTCPAEGAVTITLQVTDGDCSDSAPVTVTCVPSTSPPALVRINEVESNMGTPGDWVELYNAGQGTADVSGWIFKDNDDTHAYAIPAGTTIPPGGFLVLEESAFGFGLGANESARLFDAGGATVIDSHSWTAHAAVTYGRCPDGTGSFTSNSTATKGAANACAAASDAGAPEVGAPQMDAGSDAGADTVVVVRERWPGRDQVATVDTLNQFGDNLSGLTYQPATASVPAVLWAALNSPSLVYRMVFNGTTWSFDPADGWAAGKTIRYPSGTGNPDFEGLTKADWDSPFIYAATERNNDASSVSRLSILRVDTSAAGTTLTATHEWNLNGDLPVVGPNLGLETITWVPDSYLVGNQFLDERRGVLYDPAAYPGHGTGLFLTGVEGNGIIYAYALDHDGGSFQRVATIPSGHPGVMALEFDRDAGALWAQCDNTCANTANVLGVVGGRFAVRRSFARPSTLPDSNNEGLAIAPDSSCQGGLKSIFWSDDSHFAGHALRTDSIPCGPLF